MTYDETERRRAALERRLLGPVAAVFVRQGRAIAAAVAAGRSGESVAGDLGYAREAVALCWGAAAPPFAAATYAEVEGGQKKAPAPDEWLRAALQFLAEEGGAMVAAITDTVLSELRGVLAAGVAEGLSAQQVARNLREAWPDLTAARALRIVRTEVIAASNWGAIRGANKSAEDYGLTLEKGWLSTPDSRTRPDHADANGQTRAMDEDFSVGGEAAAYPGDPRLSASQRVQCRCTVVFNPVDAKSAGARPWRVERDERIKARVDEVREGFASMGATFDAVAEEFTEGGEPVSARTVERAYWGR